MTQLHFRFIVIPEVNEEPDINVLRRYVERWGLVVQTIKRVQLEKTKQTQCPEILEYIIDIRAQNQSVISNKNKVHVYKDLISKWCRTTRTIYSERLLLQLSDNECFIRKRVSCHPNLKLQNISFGVQARLGEYISYATIGENSTATFIHDLKELEIVTELLNEEVVDNDIDIRFIETRCILKILYTHIRNVIVSIDEEFFEVYLDLMHPPLFFKENRENRIFRNRGLRFRSIRKESRTLPFGVDRLVIGKSSIVRLKFHYVDAFYEILSCLRYRTDKIPIHFIKMFVTSRLPPSVPPSNFGHFGCTYMWTAIVNRTFLILEQAADIKSSLNKLVSYSLQSKNCLEKVLTTLLFLIDTGGFLNYWNVIDKLFAYHVSMQKDGSFKDICVPEKCRLIRRAIVTPTRVMLFPPDLMCENRILRNFDSEFFLRVTFRDDDFTQMNFRMYDESVFETVVTRPVNSGIPIGDRHYQLLAWSSSQLKEHGVSMYAKDSKGITAHDIRRWTEINPRTTMNIPKCLARIGQCFSQTEDTLQIPLNNAYVRFERDIEGGFDPSSGTPYVFSDGIGRISEKLIQKVRKTFRHNRECCALQIRYSGCKGMLVLDPTLRGADIVFRESMRKFDCRGQSHTKLEIVKKSGPIPLRLNRPLVAILHDLGVNPRVFLRLQEVMLQNLIDMLLDEEKAANYLNFRTPFSIFKFKELTASGICLTQEPFFRTLLLSLHRYYIGL
ncbi:RNA-dependent RNA polymerase 2 [Araneus ventricosus]|uniref:RNA-dependent RNA polymerase n=1 Tax=Araneus ventricosus TaxID=182803 RepID=A0A4Y2EC41_ARAVE|nr:RNA-dependent RNA polymerase 2 [Araneus ventricosus]